MTIENERRSEPRLALARKLVISHYAIGQHTVQTHDLSLTGAFIGGRYEGVGIGDKLNISFELAPKFAGDRKGREYHLGAEVRRVTAEGIGIHFDVADSDAQGGLYKLIHQK